MNIEKVKKTAWNIVKDVLVALLVVIIVMGALFAYCQVWPPVVVVESGSMMHGVNSEIGIIDTGDMVLVKKAPAREDVITFVEGESRNQRTYGEFGDVIIYRPNGRYDLTPIIHRAVVWLEINTTHVQTLPDGEIDFDNYTYDVPELGLYDTSSDIVLPDYGYKERDVVISLDGVIYNFRRLDIEPHSGYITMGDNNSPTYDQRQGSYLLVKEEWVVGRAFGELPWFGLIKLSLTGELRVDAPPNSWQNLSVAILIILGIPLFIDFGLPLFLKKDGDEERMKASGSEDEVEGMGDDDEKEGREMRGPGPERGIESRGLGEVVPEDTGTIEKVEQETSQKAKTSQGGRGQIELADQIPSELKVSIEKPDGDGPGIPAVTVIKEKETIIIKEIVKIPCSHCGVMMENTENECSSCGAPIR